MSDVVLCEVFRSPKREGMYLYVDRAQGLERVPDALLRVFGKPESALVFRLSAKRKLARVRAEEVLAGIGSQGYFLQMPPAEHGDRPIDAADAADAADAVTGEEC